MFNITSIQHENELLRADASSIRFKKYNFQKYQVKVSGTKEKQYQPVTDTVYTTVLSSHGSSLSTAVSIGGFPSASPYFNIQ